ncbi:hypothetical protein ARMA_0205 [Ardenticatena maritima]|uniref:Uncharacterized protein n=2 Tax=Ardenticatena maritima TaxID=872965 RepID=A0A0M8K6L2_9CHLR|nr:hypothetical protein [Ardenticatena maritima]KPL87905.1 hypothetical protein SE16_10250 [Ardenticatena maritima]GAP61782.1 hypothetical protein ARMA_0205 [Ardenticatena maritima]
MLAASTGKWAHAVKRGQIVEDRKQMKHHSPLLNEAIIDQCFLMSVIAYMETLPPDEAANIEHQVHLLLPLQQHLSPSDQLAVMSLLWEHEGSLLEHAYRLKEDLKRCLRYGCNDDQSLHALLSQHRQGAWRTPLHALLERVLYPAA